MLFQLLLQSVEEKKTHVYSAKTFSSATLPKKWHSQN
jgi:hypothetical protein